MNNLHRVQNIFISNGSALPANNAAITALSVGQIGVYGHDMTALNPAGGDTVSTQPFIYIVEKKTDSTGTDYVKRSMKIAGNSVISYNAESYAPSVREVWAIGYNRATSAGSIEVNSSTDYNYSIRFKNDKWLYSERPEVLNVTFRSATAATQLSIATQIADGINNSSFNKNVVAIVVGNGTGVYGVTGATAFGVEITAKEVDQLLGTTYTLNQVYFSVHVNDSTGFESTTPCAQIIAFDYGVGTYNQTYVMENKAFGYEGVTNRRQWPIPVLDYSSTSALISSSAITPVATGTAGQDTVTFDLTIAGIIRPGEEVTIDGVNYKVKYIRGNGTGVGAANAVVLTSVLLTSPASAATLVRYKYDLVTIEFNDAVNTPTGVVAVANKSVVIAVPAINAGAAYTTLSSAGTNLVAILNGWMATTPLAPAAISI